MRRLRKHLEPTDLRTTPCQRHRSGCAPFAAVERQGIGSLDCLRRAVAMPQIDAGRRICRCRCAEGNSDRRERAVVGVGNRAFDSNADFLPSGPRAVYGTPPVARLYLEAREGRASSRGARERSRTSKIDSGRDEGHDHPARSRRRFGARPHRLSFQMIVEQDVKNKRPIRHCEQSEAIQTWAARPRLSLDCFAVARNDDASIPSLRAKRSHPDLGCASAA
jgi:hypothetical protein